MRYNEENILTVVTFLEQLLQEKNKEKLFGICYKCIENIREYSNSPVLDHQIFLTSVFTKCNISFFQSDGIKTISNYIAFKNSLEEEPVLMIINNRTLMRILDKKDKTENKEERFVWLEKDVKERYMLHVGNVTKVINRRQLFHMCCNEKKNLCSQYFLCALILFPPMDK